MHSRSDTDWRLGIHVAPSSILFILSEFWVEEDSSFIFLPPEATKDGLSGLHSDHKTVYHIDNGSFVYLFLFDLFFSFPLQRL
jgi:hypothetical protein